ncbi:MAG: AAA family ATPase, partial [Bacteroidota bacterium]
MLPWRIGRLSHHKYVHQNTEILKQSVIYGANGAGKSNLIKSIGILKKLIISGELPIELTTQKFKLSDSAKNNPVVLAIEFVNKSKAFSYAIKVNNGVVEDEQLYLSGLGKEDKLIFERKTHDDRKSEIKFFDGFENITENKVLKSVIEKDLIRPDKPLLTLLNGLSNESFAEIKACHSWFVNNIEVIFPRTVPKALVQQIDIAKNFKEFTNELVCSFNTGVVNVDSEKRSLEEYLGEDDKNKATEIIADLKANPKKMIGLRHDGDEVVIVNENGEIVAKRLLLEHMGESNKKVAFHINEESDGTARLL